MASDLLEGVRLWGEMNGQRDFAVRRLARDIEAYLRLSPDAADTADGIRLLWLRKSDADCPIELVECALEHLEERGRVLHASLPDGSVVYRRGPHASAP